MIPANRIGLDLAACPTSAAVSVPVGGETVLIRGWDTATVLNPSAAAIWDCFDGRSTLGQVIENLAALTGVEHAHVADEVLAFARRVGTLGLLDGVGPPDDVDIRIEEMPGFNEVGTPFPPFTAVDLDGVETTAAVLTGTETLVVNWNPNCGYCASIARLLAACEPGLAAHGVRLVLLAGGSVESNQEMLHAGGFRDAHVLRLVDGEPSPLPGIGTPAAYHLDAEGRLVSTPAYGNVEVPALAARLAGADLDDLSGGGAAAGGVRYLLETGGLCAQGGGTEPVPHWVATRVYRLRDFHVGLRCGNDATVEALDSLFDHAVTDDPAAGHTFVVSLADPASDGDDHPAGSGSRASNLLVQGSRVFVRSGSPSRVLRALLWHLHDGIVGFDPACGRLRVNATAALVGDSVMLLQPGLYVLGERLQPLLAERGIALADVLCPEIDIDTCEVVLPQPAIDHDPAVLDAYDTYDAHDAHGAAGDPPSELPAVLPGRYPLIGWGVMNHAEVAVTRFTPAEAAAATLSFVQHTDDAPARIAQLGALFGTIPGFGLWYHSEAGYAAALCEALDNT